MKTRTIVTLLALAALMTPLWGQQQITGTFNNSISTYNNVSTVSNGLAAEVAKADQTVQAANISATTLYAVPAAGAGLYRVSCYVVVTQAASTSSTMPNCQITWTDNDSNTANTTVSVTPTSTGNTVGTTNSTACPATCTSTFPASQTGGILIDARASTNIQYATAGYASTGGTVMQYAVHVRLEWLGS